MSTQAQALVAEVDRIEEVTGTKVEATILVIAVGSDDLAFSSSSPDISIDGKQIFLKPSSSGKQPILYDLAFQAGSGVASFSVPAVTFGREDKKGAIAVNPDDFRQEFRLSFVNDIPPGDRRELFEFNISWTPAILADLGEVVRRVITDPTILLDPPNS
jgi:hypothetical protein